MAMKPKADSIERPPKRRPKEEEELMKFRDEGIIKCYFCGKEIDDWENDLSTEYGIFSACTDCWRKWANPNQDL